MLHEYAVDPGVLSNWPSFRYLMEKFGFERGRLISRFPKQWKRMVYEACGSCREIERKRIEEGLRAIDGKLIRVQREYDGGLAWLENAEAQHLLKPFHAIISDANPRNVSEVLIADELQETTPLWKVDREICIPRTAADLAKCVERLLKHGTEFLFIDPHFKPIAIRYQNTLEKFVEVAVTGDHEIKRIEYHLEAKYDAATTEFFGNECREHLSGLIPDGIEITFFRWKGIESKEGMHPRYILTDRGGVRVEWGLDEGADGQTTDVSLLSESVYKTRWAAFQRGTAAFELADEIIVVGQRK
jgi:hypothetical protein